MHKPLPSAQQLTLIETNNGTVNVTPGAAGACYEKQTAAIDHDTKRWLQDIAAAKSEATGQSVGASTIAREAIHFYRQIYPHRTRLQKYWKTIMAVLETLPCFFLAVMCTCVHLAGS